MHGPTEQAHSRGCAWSMALSAMTVERERFIYLFTYHSRGTLEDVHLFRKGLAMKVGRKGWCLKEKPGALTGVFTAELKISPGFLSTQKGYWKKLETETFYGVMAAPQKCKCVRVWTTWKKTWKQLIPSVCCTPRQPQWLLHNIPHIETQKDKRAAPFGHALPTKAGALHATLGNF